MLKSPTYYTNRSIPSLACIRSKSGIDTTFPLAQSEVSPHNQNDPPLNNQNDIPQNNQNGSHTTLNTTSQYTTLFIRFRAHAGIITVNLPHCGPGHVSCAVMNKMHEDQTREWLAKDKWHLYPFGHPSRIQVITLQHVFDNMAIEDTNNGIRWWSSLL